MSKTISGRMPIIAESATNWAYYFLPNIFYWEDGEDDILQIKDLQRVSMRGITCRIIFVSLEP